MRFKNKKLILYILMTTMASGLLTLTFGQALPIAIGSEKSKATETIAIAESGDDLSADNTDALAADVNKTAFIPTIVPTSTPVPSPTSTTISLPVYAIEEEGYPEVEKLMQDYYAAMIKRDVGKLRSLSFYPASVATEEQLISKTEYDEDYRNIKCYTQKGPTEGTYIVYVYYETKITGINTLAPNLSKFYIVTDEEGNLKTYDGKMDTELKAYFDARNEDEGFKELLEMMNQKIEEARAKDEDLRDFWDEIANKKQKEVTAQ